VPIGQELRRRGHGVVFALSPVYEAAIRAEGLNFHAVGPPPAANPSNAADAFDPAVNDASRFTVMRDQMLPDVRGAAADLIRVCEGADVLCTMPAQLAGPIAAEAAGLDWITLTLYAANIPSRDISPVGLEPAIPLGVLSRVVNPMLWPIYLRRMRVFDPEMNEVRHTFGLKPIKDGFVRGSISPHLCLLLMSRAYIPPPPDWPPQLKLTGFADWDRPVRWEEPPDLESFLEDGEPPVVFTLGTSTALRPDQFFEVALEAALRSKRRAILLLGIPFNGLWEQRYGAHGVHSRDLAAWPYVPLSRLLPRCSAVVHPGGYGTTVATIRAGLPAVVIPRVFDQGFNAHRVKVLGVGRTLAWKGLTADRLRRELEAVLADSAYRSRAAALGKTIAAEAGAVMAADEIERFLTRRERRSAASPDSLRTS
jgi:rhamnosyltransferase subunit B